MTHTYTGDLFVPVRNFDWRYRYHDSAGSGWKHWIGDLDFSKLNLDCQFNIGANFQKPSVDIESLRNLAIAEAWANVSRSEFLAAVSIAEAEKTYKFCLGLLKQCVKYVIQLRKLKFSRLSAGAIQQKWLEYRYGLRPLLYDIRSAAQALQALGTKPRIVVRSHKVAEVSSSSSVTTTTPYPFCAIVDVRETVIRRVHVSAGVLLEPSISQNGITQAFGLDIDDVAPTLWELVPFSFMVDWFCNVADVLAAWSPHSEVRVLASWSKVSDLTTWDYQLENWRQNPSYHEPGTVRDGLDVSAYGGRRVHTVRETTRVSNPDRPVIPTVEVRLDLSKAADILAFLYKLK